MNSADKSTLPPPPPAEFQTAIAATKFGICNVALLLVSIPACWAIQVESTLSSYIVPAAVCDLKLDPAQKGLLTSTPFFGMVTSGLIWGFLLDTLGRRRILLHGFALHTLVVLLKSCSQNVVMLSILNFLGGALTGGLYVALTTYILEFYSTEYRSRIQMAFGMMYSCGNLMMPLISSVILPLKFHVQFLGGLVEMHAWNLLILASSVCPLVCFVAFCFLPETPKYLMSVGENGEALEVFRRMYRWNTGKCEGSYPIKTLIEEINPKTKSTKGKQPLGAHLRTGWAQISPLFHKQYRGKLMLVCLVQGIILMSNNTLRLYMPLIFQATHEYEASHNGSSTNLCNILDLLRKQPLTGAADVDECSVNLEDNFRVYLNSAIIAATSLLAYVLTSFIIKFLGMRLLGFLGVVATLSVSALYFSPNTATTLALSSVYSATLPICFDILVPVVVVMFPTTLRAMAMSICVLGGRTFSVVGNNLMPVLVEAGCAPPFFTLGAFVITAASLSLLIPNNYKEDMK